MADKTALEAEQAQLISAYEKIIAAFKSKLTAANAEIARLKKVQYSRSAVVRQNKGRKRF